MKLTNYLLLKPDVSCGTAKLSGHETEMYDVPLGAVDFETGGIVPFGALASEVYPVDLAADLVSQGRLHDAGFVVFEGCDSSVSRVLWIRRICDA